VELPLRGKRHQTQLQVKEQNRMKDFFTKLYVKAQIFREDNGQDLIEYALVVALIAFAATVGMATVATRINAAFVAIGNKVTSYTT
jgi:pilus assembly protein Flp/PilA